LLFKPNFISKSSTWLSDIQKDMCGKTTTSSCYKTVLRYLCGMTGNSNTTGKRPLTWLWVCSHLKWWQCYNDNDLPLPVENFREWQNEWVDNVTMTMIYLFQSRTSENGRMNELTTMTGMLPAWRQSLSTIWPRRLPRTTRQNVASYNVHKMWESTLMKTEQKLNTSLIYFCRCDSDPRVLFLLVPLYNI